MFSIKFVLQVDKHERQLLKLTSVRIVTFGNDFFHHKMLVIKL